MKQTLSMLIALLLCLFAFASCDNVSFQNDDSQTTNDTPVCSRINLCYHGNKDTSITIEDAGICSELMTLITKADGTQGESSKGYYGVPYTLTIYFEGNEAPLVFCLWSDSQYSTSEQRDAEGYQYFFNDDLSDLYQYLEEKYPDEFWCSNNSQSGDSNTECVHTYGEWQYDETYHWCDWSCSLDLCDIDTTGEHFDEDENDVCDKCGYFPLINSNVNSGNHDVHDAFDIRISWANWLDGTIVNEGCLNFDQLAISSVHHIPLHKFSSRSELDAFKARFGEDNSFDYGYNGKSFNENTADYDDAFFEENDLFLVYVDANSGSFSFDVNNIFNDGKSFGIYVNQTNNPEAVTDDMAGWFITIAVPKLATENCTLFDAIMGFPPCIDSNDMVDAVILKDGFAFKESWIDSNNELTESKTFVVENQEALNEIFTEFKDVNFDKEMVIVYCYTTIYIREQKLEKVSFDNNILSIEFDVVDGKPGTGDATAPQTRTCVICLDKVAATEVKITYNGQ